MFDFKDNFHDLASNDFEREMMQNDRFLRGVIQNNLVVNGLIYDNLRKAKNIGTDANKKKPKSKEGSQIRDKLS